MTPARAIRTHPHFLEHAAMDALHRPRTAPRAPACRLTRPALTRVLALAALVLAALLAAPATIARADDAKARAIMRQVNDRDDGDNQTAGVRMVLIDKGGNQRVRELRSFRKDKGPDTLSILFFEAPADVKGTGFLTYDYNEAGKDDDQWLYLPALRKSKRIASSDKSGSFMGSDFNYSDMTKPDLEDFDFTLKREVEVDGAKTWEIESVPRKEETADETGYSKGVAWVRQDNHVVIRGVRWVYKSSRLKFMQVTKLEQIDGIWTPLEMKMDTREGNSVVHSTVLSFKDVKYNQKLGEEFFTVRQLEKGP